MIRVVIVIVLWMLAAPVFGIVGLLRLLKRRRFWSFAYRSNISCRTCRAEISLVGVWECRCGYTYRGHLLRECPICHSVPRMVRCYSCGTTQVLPEP